ERTVAGVGDEAFEVTVAQSAQLALEKRLGCFVHNLHTAVFSRRKATKGDTGTTVRELRAKRGRKRGAHSPSATRSASGKCLYAVSSSRSPSIVRVWPHNTSR